MLLAAIQFIPATLGEIEFVGYGLLESYVLSSLNLEPDSPLWVMTRFTQFQVLARALVASLVLILFFQSSAVRSVTKQQTSSTSPQNGWRTWFLLPVIDKQADRVGITVIIIALTCYSLWIGALHSPTSITRGLALFSGIALLTFSATILGVIILGIVPSMEQYWPWVIAASLVFALAVLIGFMNTGGQVVLAIAPLLLLLGTLCLVFGIGRLLRIIQYQIGLGKRTTITVALSTFILYLNSQLISRLI